VVAWCGAGDPKPGGLGFAGLCVRGTAERRDGGDLMEERDAEPRRRAAVSEKAGNGRGDSRRRRPGRVLGMREMREGRKCYGWPKVDNRFCQYRSLQHDGNFHIRSLFVFWPLIVTLISTPSVSKYKMF
jgi:hypothetical protein